MHLMNCVRLFKLLACVECLPRLRGPFVDGPFHSFIHVGRTIKLRVPRESVVCEDSVGPASQRVNNVFNDRPVLMLADALAYRRPKTMNSIESAS